MRFTLLSTAALAAIALAVPAVSIAAPAKPEIGSFGFDVAGMDRTKAPGDDFVAFANGTYLRKLEIPADRASYGMFTKLDDLSRERTRGIIEAAASQTGGDAAARKVGDFYASFMDESGIEAKGVAPLKPLLAQVDAIRTPSDLSRALGGANRMGIDVPFGTGAEQDLKNPDVMVVYLGQGGLGMPDRDYYLDTTNTKFVETAGKYRAYLAQLFRLAGYDQPEARAQRVYDLETKIARVHWSRVEQRQIDKLYNPVATSDLPARFPGVDWGAYMTAAGVAGQPQVIAANPSAIEGMAKLAGSEAIATWRDYLAARTIDAMAPVLPKAFVDARFAFRGTALSGQPQNTPRWKRGVDMTNDALGEAVGQLYVARYFPPAAKAEADRLVRNVIAAMDQRLATLTWMAPETKAKAREKLASFTPKIGYPAKWRDYSALEVVRGDAFGNMLRASAFEYQRQLDKIGKPIDRSEWAMTPMEVNAYANPLWNEIVFPAAILQPPFFDPAADPAVNYGGIGAVIGHEISHHFDDQGRKFDKDGKLADWWTPADVERFTKLTAALGRQYGAYEPLPRKTVNGDLTMGENIADLAGLTVAYDAYQRSLGGKPAPVIDGFTGDQRFFLGWAQVWRTKYRDSDLLRRLTTDPHTPGHFRPYVVRNLDSWYRAFGVKPGQTLYLDEQGRVRIW